jgi:hypothetical protein
MHLNFAFSARQVLWTLTFASQLVLLVVLLGRDRARRYPWFTAGIVLIALRLLAEVLLSGRMAPIPMQEIFITLAFAAALVGLMVVIEIAWRAFVKAKWLTWTVALAAMAAVTGYVLKIWGEWPAWHDLLPLNSQLAVMKLMQLAALKGDLAVNLLTVEIGLLVVLFGSRFGAPWRSHTQMIAIGLSTASIASLGIRGAWQIIAQSVHPTTQQEYQRILGLGGKLFNANKVVYIAALLWWIAWLWLDEPGKPAAAAVETPASVPAPVPDSKAESAAPPAPSV